MSRTSTSLRPRRSRRRVVSGEDSDSTMDVDESTTRLKVVWHPPHNTGPRTIISYEVEFKKSTETSFGRTGVGTISGNTVEITGLEADTSYDVRVQATNAEGFSTWSFVGTGSTNKEGNSPPQSNEESVPATLSVAENTPAGENVGSPVTAADQDTTTLTYELNGPDKDLFNFNTRSGQIRTKAPLNHEDPRCGYVGTATPTACTYRVTVVVVDGAGGSDATGVNIQVNDKIEAPSAPNRPTVRAKEKSSTSLVVSWNAPENRGPDSVKYDVQYRKGSDTFSDDNCGETGGDNCVDITGTSVTIVGLDGNTSYEVRVKANNGERPSGWSVTGTGRTNKANHQPRFRDRPGAGPGSARGSDLTVWRTIDENPQSGHTVGGVFADDQDNDRLTYSLQASEDARAEAAKFTIDETTGQIRTKAGVTYNYEDIDPTATSCDPLTADDVGEDRCYTVEVEVRDGLDDNRVKVEVEDEDADDSITVKISVRDRDEPPAVPTVTVTSPARDTTNNITTLEVFWHARNTGPDIASYDVQYQKGGASFLDDNCRGVTEDGNCLGIIGTNTTIITRLDADISYSVQVRARNEEGTSNWSRLLTVKTNKGENNPPTFQESDPVTLNVLENNTPAIRDVGNAVGGEDDASTSLTYSLGGRDAALFTIVPSSGQGQIRTKAKLNHEDPECGYDSTAAPDSTTCTYTVRVKVDDRAGGSASIVVNIMVEDEDEAPSKPSATRVTATKDTGWSLDVTWNEPRDTGKPPVTDYDIEYRKFKSGTQKDQWQEWPHGTDDAGNTDRSAKIRRRAPDVDADPLEPRTQYEVRVRAKNQEGEGEWSPIGRGTTGASNRRPIFDITDAVIGLSVYENTRAGQNLGNAVSASDTDSNSLTYTLEGPGADSFTIVSSSGQIRTRSPLDYETRSRATR